MHAPHAISNDLRAELEASVVSILQRAVSASPECRNPDTATTIIETARNAFDAAASSALAWRNAQYSPQHRLPTELWYLIWTKLGFFDYLAISHVCSRWRAAALDCATLWTHINFYTSVHHPVCTCSMCPNGGYMSIHGVGWSGTRRYPERSSNWRLLPLVLPRSRDLPLSVTLEVLPSYAADTMIRRLGSALLPHVSRLTHLLVLSADAGAVSQFLRSFDTLPALRTLRVGNLPTGTGETEPFLCAPIELPALECLDIATDALIWSMSVPLALPSVRELSCRIADRREILTALRACTGLSRMHIRVVPAGHTQSPLNITALQMHAAAVGSVTVEGVSPSDEVWLFPAFHHAARTTLKILYYGLANEGLRMFTDLSPTALDVQISNSGFGDTISASDDAGRTRTLSCVLTGFETTLRLCEAVWPHLLAGRELTRLTLDSSAWNTFVATFPCSEVSIQNLCIVVCDPVSLAGVVENARGAFTFSRLTSLRIARVSHHVQLPASDISALVHILDAPIPLENLTVARSRVPQEDRILDELAASVSFFGPE